MLDHERRYRGEALLRRLAELSVTIGGAGALGANLAEHCARMGFRRLRVIDRDRVEERNLSTQPFERADIGRPKARTLAHMLFRAVGVEIDFRVQELTAVNAGALVAGSDVVVDCFDNTVARKCLAGACASRGIPCLHVGLNAGYAEIVWNEAYRVPNDAGLDLCDYPLSRTVVALAAAGAVETLVRFADRAQRLSFSITLEDLAIRPLDGLGNRSRDSEHRSRETERQTWRSPAAHDDLGSALDT